MELSPTPSEPVAIITSGGGMKCAYAGGALVALARELGIRHPDMFVAASGSVGSMFYYLSGQYDAIQKAWTSLIPSPQFIRYTPFPSMRIDYLVDTIFKEYVPLNTTSLYETQTKYFVPVTDVETGLTNFISNDTWFDPYEVMRAAKAVPILYNGHVHLGGRSFLDGDFSTSLASLVQKAIDLGAKRILCITNTDAPTKFEGAVLRAYARLLNPALRAVFLDDYQNDKPVKWPDGIEFMTLSPSLTLPSTLYTRDRRRVSETFTMGYEDLLSRRAEVEQLFGCPPRETS